MVTEIRPTGDAHTATLHNHLEFHASHCFVLWILGNTPKGSTFPERRQKIEEERGMVLVGTGMTYMAVT
jgi:hypothetical protein